MRLLLLLLALGGLLASPVTAAAAQAACGQHGAAMMAGMDMPTDNAANGKLGVDPCCDHGKSAGKACAQACATACGIAVALPPIAMFQLTMPVRDFVPAPVVTAHTHDPPGLYRPPRSIA